MKPSGTRNRLLLGAGVLILGIALYLGLARTPSSDADLGIGTVKRETLEQKLTISGNIVPNRSTVVTAPFTGYVKKIYVKVGQDVKAGDPLFMMTQSLQSTENSFPLRAPFPGKVVQIGRTEGQLSHLETIPEFILRVDDLSKLFITAAAPEIDWVKISPGQEVEIRAAPVITRTYKGVIRELSLASKQEENNYSSSSKVEFPVKLEILDPDKQLSPGMTAVVDIIANKRENVLTLLHEYVNRDGTKYFVTMANGEKRPIEIGMQNEEAFEIKSGLQEGDRVKQVDFASLLKE
ncbi:MAG: efflux RND transporter periplasmic adaptor subunit [Bdellovibrionota bacterium]